MISTELTVVHRGHSVVEDKVFANMVVIVVMTAMVFLGPIFLYITSLRRTLAKQAKELEDLQAIHNISASVNEKKKRLAASPATDKDARESLVSFMHYVYITETGQCFHTDQQCIGLNMAKQSKKLRICKLCVNFQNKKMTG